MNSVSVWTILNTYIIIGVFMAGHTDLAMRMCRKVGGPSWVRFAALIIATIILVVLWPLKIVFYRKKKTI